MALGGIIDGRSRANRSGMGKAGRGRRDGPSADDPAVDPSPVRLYTRGVLAKVHSCAIVGLEGAIVEVEVDTARGLPHFAIDRKSVV